MCIRDRYKGTDAKERANIKKNIETKANGVSFFLSVIIKFPYYKFQYYKMLVQIEKS